jgi:hypothetical protein
MTWIMQQGAKKPSWCAAVGCSTLAPPSTSGPYRHVTSDFPTDPASGSPNNQGVDHSSCEAPVGLAEMWYFGVYLGAERDPAWTERMRQVGTGP